MAELFFHHEANMYLFDTKLLKLYRLDGSQSVEIDNLETIRQVRLKSAEISPEKAQRMLAGC
jgi:hypothetical protein